jgi:hypothetical protein
MPTDREPIRVSRLVFFTFNFDFSFGTSTSLQVFRALRYLGRITHPVWLAPHNTFVYDDLGALLLSYCPPGPCIDFADALCITNFVVFCLIPI